VLPRQRGRRPGDRVCVVVFGSLDGRVSGARRVAEFQVAHRRRPRLAVRQRDGARQLVPPLQRVMPDKLGRRHVALLRPDVEALLA